jgi:hypothetical protein
MELTTFWTTITILSAASGGGFLYLMRQCGLQSKDMEKIQIELANKTSFKDVSDDYARKEVVELQIKGIEKDIRLILEKISELKKG